MRCLFLDNFRGFRSTMIPLLDVNFLVGENSTGKTSLLTMLHMFSGPSIFMETAFENSETIAFGHFEEMVSAHSEDKSYFRLGYVAETGSGRTKKTTNGILLTYHNIDGLAQISRFSTIMGGRALHLRFEGKKVFFKNDPTEPLDSITAMCGRLQEWVTIQNSSHDGTWSEIKSLPDEVRRIPLLFLLGLARADGNFPKEMSFPMPFAGPQLVWIAPIRSKPRRTYDEPQTPFSSEGAHIPYVIRRMLSSESDAEKFKEFIEQIGKASGLFEKIEIKKFGDSEVSPFEVDAYLDNMALGIGWLGYGVSQSLPIFVEILDRPRGSWFAIQQPEVHLHPRAQACVGDVFFEMASRENKRFIIETHSDFIIDRFRLNYRKRRHRGSNRRAPESQVLFFERKAKTNVVTPLRIGRKGELPSDQPQGYRNFFIKEEMEILGL
jgi:predicted ATPase